MDDVGDRLMIVIHASLNGNILNNYKLVANNANSDPRKATVTSDSVIFGADYFILGMKDYDGNSFRISKFFITSTPIVAQYEIITLLDG